MSAAASVVEGADAMLSANGARITVPQPCGTTPRVRRNDSSCTARARSVYAPVTTLYHIPPSEPRLTGANVATGKSPPPERTRMAAPSSVSIIAICTANRDALAESAGFATASGGDESTAGGVVATRLSDAAAESRRSVGAELWGRVG